MAEGYAGDSSRANDGVVEAEGGGGVAATAGDGGAADAADILASSLRNKWSPC